MQRSIFFGNTEVNKLPSAKVLEEKQKIVNELAEKIKSSQSGVLVDYKGITVIEDTKLRKDLRNAGVEYSVIKNSLISKACDTLGYEKLKEVLIGMTALALSNEDPVAPAKILNEFSKKNSNFVIKAGFVEGEVLDADGIKELAAIPSKEELIGKFMGSLQSSLYKFAYALQAIIDKNESAKDSNEDEPVSNDATEN